MGIIDDQDTNGTRGHNRISGKIDEKSKGAVSSHGKPSKRWETGHPGKFKRFSTRFYETLIPKHAPQ
ncbi:MAG TPA: hypothetical protein DEB39_14845 [Planctomycetaceae bacterium]|nr:hypothetical protein [Planctomycetaceae bacterium]